MAELGTVFVDVEGKFDGMEKKSKSKFSAFGKVAVGAFAAAFIGKQIFDFGKDAFKQAEEYGSLVAGVGNLVENQAKSLGSAATLSTEGIVAMADSLQDLTGFSNEQILTGAQQLATFTNIQNAGEGASAVFDRATMAIADMVASGALTDFNAGAIGMGKALNDPIKGVTALAKAGVAFTEEQKEQIQVLQDSGDILGAQVVILDEIEKVYGGTAAATRDDSAVMANSMQDVKVAIGTAIAPIVTELVPVIKDVLAPALQNLAPLFGVLAGVIVKLLPPIVRLIDKLLPLVEKIIPPLVEIVEKLFEVFLALAEPILDIIFVVLDPLIDIVVLLAGDLLEALMPAILAVADAMVALTPLLLLATDLLKPLMAIVGALAKIIGVTLAVAIDLISAYIGFWIDRLTPLIEWLTGLWETISGALEDVLPGLLSFFEDLPATILGFIGDAAKWLIDVGKDLITGFIDGIKSMAGNIVKAIRDFVINKIPGPIKSFFGMGSPSKLMAKFGMDISKGMALGIEGGAGDVRSAVDSLLHSPKLGLGIPPFSVKGGVGASGLTQIFNGPVGGDIGEFADMVADAQARELRYQLG